MRERNLMRQTTPPFFWKCVILKGFKSFVLKVCETKGLADAFLRKCVKLKSLGSISGSFEVSVLFLILLGDLSSGLKRALS